MAFTKTYDVDCDLTDQDGSTSRFEDGQVTVGGAFGEAEAHAQVKTHFADQGVTATNIHTTSR